MGIRRVLPCLMVALGLVVPADALAQAWLPARGETFLSLSYQFLTSDRHLFSTAPRSVDGGTVQSQVLLLDGDFGVTDRLAVNAAVAFVNGRYVEGGTHGPLDDGHWHGSFQDARIGARFMAVNDGSWVLTPSIAYGFPTTNYVVLGHAALGRHLNELRLGLDWGKLLSAKAYLQGNYSYAFMENVEDIPLDRSNLSVEFGYFINEFLTLQTWTDYQNMHGGLNWRTEDRSHVHFALAHDRTAASDFVRVGGGASVTVNESVEFYVNVAKTVWGINTHNALTVSLGMSWGFDMFGGRDLGVWEQRDDTDSDMDDWLLEDFAGDANDEEEEQEDEEKQDGKSS